MNKEEKEEEGDDAAENRRIMSEKKQMEKSKGARANRCEIGRSRKKGNKGEESEGRTRNRAEDLFE